MSIKEDKMSKTPCLPGNGARLGAMMEARKK